MSAKTPCPCGEPNCGRPNCGGRYPFALRTPTWCQEILEAEGQDLVKKGVELAGLAVELAGGPPAEGDEAAWTKLQARAVIIARVASQVTDQNAERGQMTIPHGDVDVGPIITLDPDEPHPSGMGRG